MRAKLTICLVAVSVLGLGCQSQTTDTGTGTSTIEVTGDGFRGACAEGVTVEARDIDGVFDVSAWLNGLSLHAIIDSGAQLAEIDGFAEDNGQDTQILENDRALLLDCHRALEQQFGEDSSYLENFLVRSISLWAETPDSVELQRSVQGEEDRSYTSICSLHNSYQYATHDGWWHSNWDSDATSIAKVGTREGCTYSWINSSWTCSEPDHVPYVYQRGECYGNCGAGCPGGNQQLTWDCHDHDQCVRNGHSLASFWCNDEFVSAADDELFAPSCSGT
jgi:hypothetical protein